MKRKLKSKNYESNKQKKNNIKLISHWGQTSNVFCIHRYLLTNPEDKEEALKLLEPLISETRLLYLCK